MKLLHTADWQIGKLFGQFEPEDAALLAEARFGAVERLAHLAAEQRVSCVLVAGDVFDAQGVSDRTIRRLFNATATFDGPWILLPGNHDAALAESVWTRAIRLNAIPPNVHPCLEPTPWLDESAGIAVLPAPLTQRNTYSDLTEWYAGTETPAGFVRIGLAHGSVEGILADDIDSSNPIAAGRAVQAKLDYLALGDWHGTKQVDARTWYSGTPETDRFKANDSGQALLVELTEPGGVPKVTPIAIGQYRWHSVSREIQIPSDIERAQEHLARFGSSDVVQLIVAGRTDIAGHRCLHDAIERTRGRTRSVTADLASLHLEPTAEDIQSLQADGYVAEVIAELQARQEGLGCNQARDALILLAGILDRTRTNRGASP